MKRYLTNGFLLVLAGVTAIAGVGACFVFVVVPFWAFLKLILTLPVWLHLVLWPVTLYLAHRRVETIKRWIRRDPYISPEKVANFRLYDGFYIESDGTLRKGQHVTER